MNTLLTTWGEQLHPEHVLEEYPRPQMERDSRVNLNGFWEYAVTDDGEFPCRMVREKSRKALLSYLGSVYAG